MVKPRRFWLCSIIGSVGVMLPSTLLADVTGSILGTVTDKSSAVVPGVRVTATNLDLNLVKEATSDTTGQYRILALPVGRYKVEATLPGFRTFVQTGIVLSVNDQRRVDVVLQVGEVQSCPPGQMAELRCVENRSRVKASRLRGGARKRGLAYSPWPKP